MSTSSDDERREEKSVLENTPLHSPEVKFQKRDISHYRGCLLGGAIGDALGAGSVHQSWTQIKQAYGERGIQDYVESKDGIGRFTNKTQLLLFTAEGMLRSIHRASIKGIWGAYTTIVWQSYLRWLFTQGIDVSTDSSIISRESITSGWLMEARGLYRKRGGSNTLINSLKYGISGTMSRPVNNSKGSGGLVRVAPIGLLFYKDPEKAFRYGCELAAFTHGHPSGYLPAGYLAALLAFLNRGHTLNQTIELTNPILLQYPNHEETLTAIKKALKLVYAADPSPEAVEKLGNGRTGEEALAMAIYCAFRFRDADFEKGLWLAVNHSGDTDTVGAVTGSILGLLFGEKSIPTKWRVNLDQYHIVSQVAEDLHIEVPKNRGSDWWEKYPGF
ncbi:ADP-ribosylglycohydrolase family protein [Rufibacter immobilis]|uniref:ADP-ribosylglycohydrolase family protein n=1 Tax=Rufibacter immobilis TaxID=1348778 RepID=UPI0035F06F7C